MQELIVRLAQPEDEPEILRLCKLLHSENGECRINEQKVLNLIQKATQKKGAIIGVTGEFGNLTGSICLDIDQYWYSDEYLLFEAWNFVRADCRRAHIAEKQIEFAKTISNNMKMNLAIGVVSDIRVEAKVKFYSRFFKQSGAFFLHRPV